MRTTAFDLRLVEPFVVLVDERLRFRPASERLGIGQPALSRQMARLQHELGVKLFVRDGRDTVLTPAGARFLVDAREILERAMALHARLQERMMTLRLHLGNAAHRLIDEVVSAFVAAHPAVALEITEATSPASVHALLHDQADVAFGLRTGCPEGISFGLLERAPLGLLTAAGHRMARGDARWADLTGEPIFMGPDPTSHWNVRVRSCVAAAGISIREVIGPRVGRLHYLAPLIARGDASLISARGLFEPIPAGLSWNPLAPHQEVEFGVMWDPGRSDPATHRFVEFALREAHRSRQPAATGSPAVRPWPAEEVSAGGQRATGTPLFDLRLLTSFVAVAENLHFGHAAEQLMVAQPALSRQVAKLEIQLGAQLLVRSSRAVELTAAGATTLAAARDILDIARRAQLAAQPHQRQTGQLKLHFHYADHPVLTRIIVSFTSANPHCGVWVIDGGALKPAKAIAAGTVDLGVVFGFAAPPGLSYLKFADVEHGVWCADGHRLAGRTDVDWSDLDGEHLLVPPPGFITHYATWLRDRLVHHRVAAQETVTAINGQAAAEQMMIHDGVVSVASSTQFSRAGVVWIPFRTAEVIEYGLCWDDGNTNPLMAPFLRHVAGHLIGGDYRRT